MAKGPNDPQAYQDVINRLKEQIKETAPDDEKVKAGLLRIAMLVTSRAKINVRRHKMIDTGRLLNSLGWQFRKDGDVNTVEIGSFGVIYAAQNEFGGPMTEKQRRAMFWAMANRRVQRPPKFPRVIEKRGNTYYWRPRPYLTPAFLEVQNEMVKIISSLMGGK